MEDNDSNMQERYLAELDEIAELDRRYYLNKTPSRSDRASYAMRQEYLTSLRNHFGAEICMTQDQTTIRDVPFQLRVKDGASGTAFVSSPQCVLAHDLNNGLGVVIGHCELLSDFAPGDETIQRHLNEILTAARKMAAHLKKRTCQNPRMPSQDFLAFPVRENNFPSP